MTRILCIFLAAVMGLVFALGTVCIYEAMLSPSATPWDYFKSGLATVLGFFGTVRSVQLSKK
jgi:hypothetical protein